MNVIFKKFTVWICILSILNLASCTILAPSVFASNTKFASNIDQKFNYQELRIRIQNKSDAVRELGLPHQTDTINGNEVWYYNLISTESPKGSVAEKNNDMLESENPNLSDKYIELHFVGDEVVHWQTKGIENFPRGNKLMRGLMRGALISAGVVVGAAGIFLIYMVISVRSAGGFR